MSDVMSTILAGVGVYLLGQTIQKFIIEPLYEQRKLIGEIASATVNYRNIGKGSENFMEARKHLRTLGSQLRASLYSIPFYPGFEALGIVRSRNVISDASGSLIGMSNALGDTETASHKADTVAAALGFPVKTGITFPPSRWRYMLPLGAVILAVAFAMNYIAVI